MEITVRRPAVKVTAAQASKADGRESGHDVSLFDRTAWQDAGLVWLAQHVLLVCIIYVGRTLLLTDTSHTSTITWRVLFIHWIGWDAPSYSKIALHGYYALWTAGFSPLLPGLEHVLSSFTGFDPAVSGLLIANAAALAALGLLRVLAERECGREIARRAIIYLSFFPTALFLAMPYTESLFLLFSVGVFLALRKSNWLVAGLLTGLAILTRSMGIALVAPMLVEFALRYWPGPHQKRPSRRELITLAGGLLAPCAAQIGLMVFFAVRFGTPFAMSKAQSDMWGKSIGIPLIGFARAGGALLRYGSDPGFFQVHIVLDMAFTLLAIALTVATWRRLPLSYVSYAWGVLLIILATPNHNWYALSSNMRYMLISFPIFIVLG